MRSRPQRTSSLLTESVDGLCCFCQTPHMPDRLPHHSTLRLQNQSVGFLPLDCVPWPPILDTAMTGSIIITWSDPAMRKGLTVARRTLISLAHSLSAILVLQPL